ncbi:glycosyltransferase family protein 64 protein C5 [Selaginella moellendorffii]|nr:glycosyltransferase family protein 64 protein C5 [Selaginella moellendorffii]|eukprot:XP_002983855.2 glycosyltransferase family protein 64 protein C5 [Selaginella moellendorffii]
MKIDAAISEMGGMRGNFSSPDCCDVPGTRCRCKWRWTNPGCCSKCHDKLRHGDCLLSSPFLFFLCSFAVFGGVGMLFAWLTFSPYQYQRLAVTGSGCQPDNEGSWAIGVFQGASPFSLEPLEKLSVNNDAGSAWPVANPVLTCASASDGNHASNFVADPFLYLRDESMYIFYESKNSVTMQGDIGVAESLDQGATWKTLGIALDEPWHLSYPFVFDHDGQVYMMPEGSSQGDLRLYRAVQFPLQWTLEKVLIRKPLVDAAMVEYNGLFWIFASNFQRFGSRKNGELEVWYSSSPLGTWKQHRGNPVRNGDKSLGARNAGRLFIYNGHIYRPGQDCGSTYGSRVKLFRVETLTKDKFKEVEVSFSFEESHKGRYAWNGVRHHHLDAQKLPSGNWIAVMDGDRVPSGDLSVRIYFGAAALLFLVLLNVAVGWLLGFCVTSPKYMSLGKRGDASLTSWIRVPLSSRLHRTVLRINRDSLPFRNRLRSNLCFRLWLCFLVTTMCVASICVAVRCFFGGSGADEPYPVQGVYSQFTMLTMTYDARIWNLKMYIKHYSRCPSVQEIVVVWNHGTPPDPSDFDSAVPVRIRVEPTNSLNNRFKPDPLIKTRGVFELDDDIMVTCDDVERAFRSWREKPGRIVGFYPRLIDGDPLEYRNERHARRGKGYNMILTGAGFMDGQTAFERYWSPDVEQARAVVDELFNCEDILLNFLLANGTTSRTVEYVHPSWAIDTSRFSGAAISKDTKTHYDKRSQCLARFAKLFGRVPVRKWEFGTRRDGWDH